MDEVQLPVHGRGEPHPPFRTLIDLWTTAAATAPDDPAIEDATGRLTYREMLARAAGFAAALEALGCAGRAVVILLPNGVDFHVAYLATLLARATPAPVNPGYPPAQVRALLALARPRVVLVPPAAVAGFDLVAHELPDTELIGFARTDHAPATPRIPEADLQAPGVMLFTGGTTGISKAVLHTQGMIANAVRAVEFCWPSKARGDVWLPVAPMSHIYGFLTGVLAPVYSAGLIVVPPRFQPDLIVDLLGRHRVTIFGGGPAPIYSGLLAAENFDSTDLSALQVCPSGGAPTPVELIERWKRKTGLPILEGYGMTEMAPIATCNDYLGVRNGSVGRPIPCNRVEIVDADRGTTVLPPGQAGEIRITGPFAMRGYLGNPEETRAALRDGWIYTGDIGHLDEDGFLFITDRKKDMAIVKGFNVFPRVIEEVALTHPALRAVGVVGAPDARTGERLVLFAVTGAPVTDAELRAHLAERIAAYMIPAVIHFVDALPLTPAAKLDRLALRRIAAEEARQNDP